ncbi:MAG: FtsH protease activity modulator HflK [Phycisphaerae bacterium]|nr:FtsH protease activity modulator HflK [Phycisphaerae bacterium]
MMTSDSPEREAFFRRWWRLGYVVPLVVGLVLIGWLVSSFYTVGTDELGVVTRFGHIHRRGVEPGLHYALPWPIDRVYTPRATGVERIEVGFTIRGQKFFQRRQSDMLTGDENILKIMMVVQYKIRDPVAYLFNAEEPHWLVERAVESSIDRLVASLRVDDVLTSAKGEIQIKTVELAQELLDTYESGIVLWKGDLQVVDPPIPVMEAFKEVASAKKDSERKIDEAHEYQSRILPKARGEAQRLLSEAHAFHADRVSRAQGDADRFLSVLTEYRHAKGITRARLYVEFMERVFSKMHVVILDQADGESASRITIVDR